MSFGGSPTPPTPPGYTAPSGFTSAQMPGVPGFTSAPSFANPGSAASAGNATSTAQNANQTMQSAQDIGNMLPKDLQIGTNPTDPAAQAQYQKAYYSQYLNPAIQQSLANQYGSAPGGNSTFANAVAGQAIGQGATDWALAGQQYATNNLQNQLSRRASFFGNEGTLSNERANAVTQNQQFGDQFRLNNDQMLNNYNLGSAQMQNNYNLGSAQMQNQFGLGLFGDMSQFNLANSQMQNNYNMNSAQMQNQFNMGNFANQQSAYQDKYQNAQNMGNSWGGLVNGGMRALGAALPQF